MAPQQRSCDVMETQTAPFLMEAQDETKSASPTTVTSAMTSTNTQSAESATEADAQTQTCKTDDTIDDLSMHSTASEEPSMTTATLPPLRKPSCAPPCTNIPCPRPPGQAQKRSSIKRISSYGSMEVLGDNIPLKFSKRHSRTLPAPNRSVSIQSYFQDTSSPLATKKCVTFDQIHIREHHTTIGDNPSCSYGTPISLDWQYLEFDPVNVEDYEDARTQRRTMKQMYLNYFQRNDRLAKMGHTEDEIKAAKKATAKVRRGRTWTKDMLPFMKFEDMIESAKRKTKRVMAKNNNNDDDDNNNNPKTMMRASSMSVEKPQDRRDMFRRTMSDMGSMRKDL